MHAVTGSITSSLGAPCLPRVSHQVVPSLRLFQRGCCRQHLGNTRIHAKVSGEQELDLGDLFKSALETPSKVGPAADVPTSSPLEASSSQGGQTASEKVEQAASQGIDSIGQQTESAASQGVDSIGQQTESAARQGFNFFGKRTEQAASQGSGSIGQQTEEAAAAPKQALQGATEIAQPAAQSPSPEPSTSALSEGASTASQLPDAGTDAAASTASDAVTQAQSNPLDSVSDATQEALSAASEATASASKALNEASEGLSKGLSEATEGLSKGLSDVTEGLGQGISGVAENLNKGLSGASGAAEDLKKGLSEISGGAAEALGGAGEAVSGAASAASEQISGVVSTVSSQVGGAASGAVEKALDTLPPDVRQALLAATAPVAQALADPRVGLPAAGLAFGVSATLWWRDRFGGYAGIISADSAAELLEYENSLLVDVRSEDSRLNSGTLDLRFGSRAKGVALPLGAISRRSGTQVVNAGMVPFQLQALLIGGLNKVDRATKIIILDDFEKRAIQLARAVSSETGLRAFVLKGGIKGWAAAGLGIKESIDYDPSPLDSISDQVQERVLPTLRDPVIGPAAISGAILACTAIYDVHRTLQFVGSLGVLLTIGTIPLRYERSEDAYDDLVRPVLRVLSKFTNTKSSSGGRGKAPPQPATPVSAELLDDNEEPEYREEDSLKAEKEAGQQPDVPAPSAKSSEGKAKEPANSA